MSRFQGVCYDGPQEGLSIVSDGPYYRIALYPRLSGLTPFAEAQAHISYRYGTYVWSEPLRKWVWRG